MIEVFFGWLGGGAVPVTDDDVYTIRKKKQNQCFRFLNSVAFEINIRGERMKLIKAVVKRDQSCKQG